MNAFKFWGYLEESDIPDEPRKFGLQDATGKESHFNVDLWKFSTKTQKNS
jgi:hypothetical protein